MAMADDARIETRIADPAEGQPVIRLWPDGPPGGWSGVGPEIAFRNITAGGGTTTMIRNVEDPTLTVYAPAVGQANGAAAIICPGGGWRLLAWEHEGIDLARWLAGRGYTAFLLKYRLRHTPVDPAKYAAMAAQTAASLPASLPYAKAPRSLSELINDPNLEKAQVDAADDGRRALALVRERAAEWGISPDGIGMIGFSAGAFLTADVAMEPGGAPLAFAAPIYGGETRGRPVPADAPPMFTAITQDDHLLLRSVEGLYADWVAADRPANLHIFTRGGHGFGMVRQGLPVDRWLDLFGDWLVDLKLGR
jgi:acetyl esterase/lipase